jgi:hypothetical protein
MNRLPVAGWGKLDYFSIGGCCELRSGAVVGMAPYTIQQLDLDALKLTTLLESPAHDALAPRLSFGGVPYFAHFSKGFIPSLHYRQNDPRGMFCIVINRQMPDLRSR